MSSISTLARRALPLLGCAALATMTCQPRRAPEPGVAEAVARLSQQSSFTLFESGQVRPLALSPDGKHLFAVNTPDARLEIFRVQHDGLRHVGAVTVGLEPVAVAAAGCDEVWVVNHLSDSVSVVDVSDPEAPRVTRTLLVGDEPRDVVFAGPGRRRAFVTTAHRGQNIGFDPQLTTPGVGRADVWVFDADHLGNALGGAPLTVLSLFTDTPRALAATPDGSRVYAAGFHTGNQTTTVPGLLVNAPGAPGAPPPLTNWQGIPAPQTSLIVKWNGAHWVDERGVAWDSAVEFSLPDDDVFTIDALATPPRAAPGGAFAHVGTVLFNLAVNPVSGRVYVSNLDARNHVRFEGPGVFAGHPGVQGHTAESRITVLDPQGMSVAPRHLNKHVDYGHCCAPVPNDENARSLAFPTGMAVSGDGETLYVAALGSSKVGVYATAELEGDTFTPSTDHQIPLAGGGPTGLVLDEARGRLYVLTRFDDAIAVVDTASRAEVAHVPMHNPEPPSITAGRRLLYDASLTSAHGDSACASCHMFGDLDSLAWDLGNPDGTLVADPGPIDNGATAQAVLGDTSFHPMKGPMVTQSLRGLANHGPMHWRGDRTGGNDAPSAQPGSGTFDERAAFQKFNPAFVSLVGRSEPLTDADLQSFTDFVLQLTYPPNPNRNLDDSDTPAQARARAFYNTVEASQFLAPSQKCDSCHLLDPAFNAQYGVPAPGVFGSDNQYSFLFGTQVVKNVHLRNMYQKIGMFGAPVLPVVTPGDNGFMGDQIRGFGFMHDGVVDTMFRFFKTVLFNLDAQQNPNGIPVTPAGDQVRRDMESFMLAFPSNLKPIVGQQITLAHGNAAVAGPRVDLLEQRAAAGDCELVAKARAGDRERGFLYAGGKFLTDVSGAPAISDASLRALAGKPDGAVTFTCAPPGSGLRLGLDRDLDGILDGDEGP